jgi:restriction system protein
VSRQSRRFAKSRQSLPAPTRPAEPAATARLGISRRSWAVLALCALLAAGLHFVLRGAGDGDGAQDPAWHYAAIGLPLLLVALAVGMVWRRRRWRQRRQSDIQRMDWAEFQPLLCLLLEQHGYHLSESGNRPGVVDLVLRKNRQTYLVHAKSWKAGKLGMEEVRELYAAMVTRSAHGGIVVSAGRFGRAAMQFARETQIQLIDGPLLQQWLAKLTPASTRPAADDAFLPAETQPSSRPAAMDTQLLSEFSPTSTQASPQVPACPLCDAPMRERTARKGRHAGRKFWGCTRHPVCKGVRRWGEGV